MFSSAVRSSISLFGGKVVSLGRLTPIVCNGFDGPHAAHTLLSQVRCFAARKGTRERKLAAKRAAKVKKAAKEEKIPKYMAKKTKHGNANEVYRCKDENWPEITPIDDVYLTKFFRGVPTPVKGAVDLLQKLHHPTLFINKPNAFIYATVELDLRMKKKNKHLEGFNGIVTYPNEFESGVTNRIIAICKNAEDQLKASNAGAVLVGAGPLIKEILSGGVAREDFDFVVCHPDSYKELAVLRGVLKRRYPTVYNELLRIDIDKAVEIFSKGTIYNSTSSSVELDFGWVDVCFGRLTMGYERLEGNLKTLLNKIEAHKPSGTENISFITRTLVWTSESQHKIKIPHWEYIPGYKIPTKKGSDEKASEEKESDEKDSDENEAVDETVQQ